MAVGTRGDKSMRIVTWFDDANTQRGGRVPGCPPPSPPPLRLSTWAMISLAGVIVIINKRVAYNIGLNHAFLFASGALLTASLMHIVPESLEVRGLN